MIEKLLQILIALHGIDTLREVVEYYSGYLHDCIAPELQECHAFSDTELDLLDIVRTILYAAAIQKVLHAMSLFFEDEGLLAILTKFLGWKDTL